MKRNKIDFALVISAEHCNPNGDPLNGNRPRDTFDGRGWISDVCLKRKIRDRLQEMGYYIFGQRDDRVDDGYKSLHDRVFGNINIKALEKEKALDKLYSKANELWIDARLFGAVFSFKYNGQVSQGQRGAVSIGNAFSLAPISTEQYQIAKAYNHETKENGGKDNTTLSGVKSVIDRGAYVAYGSIIPDFCEKNSVTDEDIEAFKQALVHIFDNDAAVPRPSGSMSATVYWWEHSCILGNASPAKVHRSLHLKPCDEYPYYTADPEELEDIKLSILEY